MMMKKEKEKREGREEKRREEKRRKAHGSSSSPISLSQRLLLGVTCRIKSPSSRRAKAANITTTHHSIATHLHPFKSVLSNDKADKCCLALGWQRERNREKEKERERERGERWV